MLMWLIIIIEVLTIPIGIWMLFLREKSRGFKICSIFLIVQGSIVASITTYHSFAKDPSSQRIGTLKPKYSRPYKTNNKVATSVSMDQTSQLFTVQMDEGVIVQPLGRYVPLSLRRIDNELLISAKIHSLDGKIVAEIRDNEWILNPNNYFRINFDKSALEVTDDYEIPILQVEYLDANNIKLGGIFYTEEKETLEIYPDFPSTPEGINPRAVVSVPPGVILIIGKTGITMEGKNTIKPQDFRIQAKTLIEAWFDYSKPKKLGIRKKLDK